MQTTTFSWYREFYARTTRKGVWKPALNWTITILYLFLFVLIGRDIIYGALDLTGRPTRTKLPTFVTKWSIPVLISIKIMKELSRSCFLEKDSGGGLYTLVYKSKIKKI